MKKADKIKFGFSREIEKWKGMGWVVFDSFMQLTFFVRHSSGADAASVSHGCGIRHRWKGYLFPLKTALLGHGRERER